MLLNGIEEPQWVRERCFLLTLEDQQQQRDYSGLTFELSVTMPNFHPWKPIIQPAITCFKYA